MPALTALLKRSVGGKGFTPSHYAIYGAPHMELKPDFQPLSSAVEVNFYYKGGRAIFMKCYVSDYSCDGSSNITGG